MNFLIVYVAVLKNRRSIVFTIDERLLHVSVKAMANVSVSFDGLVVDTLGKRCAGNSRGLRAVSDFEYEFKLAYESQSRSDIETVS